MLTFWNSYHIINVLMLPKETARLGFGTCACVCVCVLFFLESVWKCR